MGPNRFKLYVLVGGLIVCGAAMFSSKGNSAAPSKLESTLTPIVTNVCGDSEPETFFVLSSGDTSYSKIDGKSIPKYVSEKKQF